VMNSETACRRTFLPQELTLRMLRLYARAEWVAGQPGFSVVGDMRANAVLDKRMEAVLATSR
jgi:hypothetical protein